jgi:Bax protein
MLVALSQHLSTRPRRWAAAGAAAAAAGLLAGLLWRGLAPPARWQLEIAAEPLPTTAVEEAFARLDYDLAQVRAGRGVPRVLVRSIPDDLGQMAEVDRRKRLFLGAVLPLVLAVNEQIMAERETVEAIGRKIAAGQALNARDGKELERLARVYRVIDEDDETGIAELSDTALIEELRLRVAPVPVSLALAQAAEESAWGLSRFADEGNALYGQWVWNDEAGIVPKKRPAGQTHSVRAFRDLYESTLSYAHNLNTHSAYGAFRRARAEMLRATGQLDGHALAGTLTRYSGRGQAYVNSLRSIIRANDLTALDRAQFIDRQTTRTAAADTVRSRG